MSTGGGGGAWSEGPGPTAGDYENVETCRAVMLVYYDARAHYIENQPILDIYQQRHRCHRLPGHDGPHETSLLPDASRRAF